MSYYFRFLNTGKHKEQQARLKEYKINDSLWRKHGKEWSQGKLKRSWRQRSHGGPGGRGNDGPGCPLWSSVNGCLGCCVTNCCVPQGRTSRNVVLLDHCQKEDDNSLLDICCIIWLNDMEFVSGFRTYFNNYLINLFIYFLFIYYLSI